jgi:hypothetical protein
MPCRALLLLGWLVAAAAAAPRVDPSWSRLPAGTEITELRTPTSRTYSNGDRTFTADITPAGGPESMDSCQPTSTGWVWFWFEPHGGTYYYRYGPELHYSPGTFSCGASYAEFDISAIPDSSRVMAAQFCCYQYEVNATPLRTRCTYAGLDPDSASDAAVYSAIRNGPVLAEIQYDSTGWVAYGLSSEGVSILQDCLRQDWVTLGINPLLIVS